MLFLISQKMLTIKVVPVAVASQEALNNADCGGVGSVDEWRCSGDSSEEACNYYLE